MSGQSARSCSGLTLAVLLCVAVATTAGADALTRVKDIRANPRGYANEVVTVEGFATQWVEASATTTSFYFLKDDWGGVIKVRTSKEQPIVGERYRVTGPVGIDPTEHDDVYVSEETRLNVRQEMVLSQPAPVTVPVTDVAEGTRGGLSNQATVLIVAIVAALALLVGLLIWVVRSQRGTAGQGEVAPLVDEQMPAPSVVEGRTIKMHAPPPGTLKILPGRLEVVAGDETVKELRFYKLKGQSTPELTFGRAAGPPYTHIQLKPMTVSSRQAKLTFINNQWVLTNFAPDTSNPTRHNGRELPVDGQVALKEGDRVEMGEAVFTFHET